MFFFLRHFPSKLLSGVLKIGSQLLFDFSHPKDIQRSIGAPIALYPHEVRRRSRQNASDNSA